MFIDVRPVQFPNKRAQHSSRTWKTAREVGQHGGEADYLAENFDTRIDGGGCAESKTIADTLNGRFPERPHTEGIQHLWRHAVA